MFVPDLPTRVDDTVCRLLEKEPEKRFPDALVLLRHLEQTIRLEDFAKSGATLTDDINRDDGAPTVATNDREEPGSAQHPGPATLMQSLMRAELAEAVRGGFFTALFNNVYVLVVLLALVILGGFWWIRPHGQSPQQSAEQRQQMFDQGAALLEQSPGPEWLRARREFFDPLLAADPETWREPLAPLFKKIELYELTRPARVARASTPAEPKSEPERLLQLAMHYRQIGDLARAERMLAALDAILAGDPGQAHLHELTAQLLAETRKQLATGEDRDQLLKAALDRAQALAGGGADADARKIWSAIIALYADDPAAAEFVSQARESLANAKEQQK
jgi:serine/threonine-protein kinase